MRPWELRPLTLGRAERLFLARSLDPVIRWRWWCRGLLRLPRWRIAASVEASDYVERQFEDKSTKAGGVRRKTDNPAWKDRDILETACQAALTLGGTPDAWRAALWEDVRYLMDWKAWEVRHQAHAMDKIRPAPGPPPRRAD